MPSIGITGTRRLGLQDAKFVLKFRNICLKLKSTIKSNKPIHWEPLFDSMFVSGVNSFYQLMFKNKAITCQARHPSHRTIPTAYKFLKGYLPVVHIFQKWRYIRIAAPINSCRSLETNDVPIFKLRTKNHNNQELSNTDISLKILP